MAIEVSRAVVPERPILQMPFPVLTYREAIDRYGSDKPDLRYGMELHDLGRCVAGPGFRVFDDGARERAAASWASRRRAWAACTAQPDRRADRARQAMGREGPGLARAARPDGADPGLHRQGRGGGAGARASRAAAGARTGDLVLIVADRDIHAQEVLGRLRVELAARLGLADPNVLAYVWVHQFPMYQWDEDARRWDATHNPFSGVMPEDVPLLVDAVGRPATSRAPDDPAGRARALQYDLALNGWELGGGSIRFHTREMLARSFALMGHSPERRMVEKFGGILEAFEYGAPPHGGIALGIDRWAALLTDQTNIREVMAFPKTSSGTDLMLDAPSPVEPGQLAELGLALAPQGRPEGLTATGRPARPASRDMVSGPVVGAAAARCRPAARWSPPGPGPAGRRARIVAGGSLGWPV